MAHVLVKAGGEIFGFYIASFSQAGDDLSQWRAYADNARGAVIGLAPLLFAVQDVSTLAVNEKTLAAQVVYDQEMCERRTREAITRAVRLIVEGDAHAGSDDEREAFGKEMARQLAVPLFLYAVTCKHPAYAHERETRLIIMNDQGQLTPVTQMRTRGSDLVPYIPSPFRVRAPGAVTGGAV